MKKKIGFIITAGHLDIEWYQPMRLFRFWTVETLEELKKTAAERDDFTTYVLDGQVFPLEEYLEVVPEDEAAMRELIRDRKLTIGPFYTQFDEWIPSAESMIRNCLYGLHKARRYGGYMRAGYLPDNFGHPRQMPQILRGFDIDSLMFMRGLPEIPGGHPDEFIYQGLDGSEVFVSHFRESYSGAFDIFDKDIDPILPRLSPYYDQYLSFEYLQELAFHDDPQRIAKNLVANARRISERYPSGVIPLISGFDHLPPQSNIGDSVKAANDMQDEIEFIMGDAEEYVRLAARRAENPAVYSMELIGSKYQFSLLGALSTRSYLKRQNFACEALLERYAEPLDALASLWGYPNKPALLDEAWRKMLINSSHDSIHGSSTDEVHVEMEARFANARQIAVGMMHDAMKYIGKHTAPWWRSNGEGTLVYAPVMSPSPQVAELYLPIRGESLVMTDGNGRTLPTQVADRETVELNGMGLPRNELQPNLLYRKVLFADTYFGDGEIRSYAGVSCGQGGQVSDLRAGDDFLENKYLRAEVEGALLHLYDKTAGRRISNLNLLEEDADAGDAWDFSPPWTPGELVRSSEFTFESRLIENGPVRAAIRVHGTMSVPACLHGDRRSRDRVSIPVEFELRMTTLSPRLDVKLTLDNTAKDHRIRLRIPMGVKTGVIKSQGHLAVLERDVERPHEIEPWRQPPTQLLPCREWVAADDGKRGLAVALKGIYDYEAIQDPRTGQPDVCCTLVRGFEYMCRINMPQRKEMASLTYHTPGAQCPGKQSAEWSYIPYTASADDKAPFIDEAQAFLYPPLAHAVRGPLRTETIGALKPFFVWDAMNIQFSAFKRRMGQKGYILRLYENQGKAVSCKIHLNGFKTAALSGLDERDGSPLPMEHGDVEVSFGAYKAVTLILDQS